MRRRSESRANISTEPKSPAEELATKLQSGTTVFSVAIRSLKSDYDRGGITYSPASRFLTERLLNIPSVHAPVHYATLTFYSANYAGKQFISTTEFTQVYKPIDVAAIFAMLYVYRRLKKLAPPEEWNFISRFVSEQVEISGHFGAAIPDVGLGNAILCGGIRAMAFASFAIKDLKQFKEYRRYLRTHPTLYDREYERRLWQCDHLDVATLLMQRLGFGLEMARSFYDAVSDKKFEEDEITGQISRFQACADSLEALSKSASPSRDELVDGSHDEKAISTLLEEVQAIKKGGSQFSWLDKGKADYVTAEGKSQTEQSSEEAHLDDIDTIQDVALDEVPEEIKQQLERIEQGQS